MSDMSNPGFRITQGKGFHVTFANGWTMSVQFGPGNYCDHYDRDFEDRAACGAEGSRTAEVAVWGPDGPMVELDGGDTVQARVTPDEVLALMQRFATMPAAVTTP